MNFVDMEENMNLAPAGVSNLDSIDVREMILNNAAMYTKSGNDFIAQANVAAESANYQAKGGINTNDAKYCPMVSPMPGNTPPNGAAALEDTNRDMAIIH